MPWAPAARRRGLSREHIFLLAILGATSFFDGYDGSIKALALTQIRETFHLSKAVASAMFAIIYLGALPAMVITRWADRIGRRRMLLWSVFGYMGFSGLTALSPNPVKVEPSGLVAVYHGVPGGLLCFCGAWITA